jgi:hypothetical protein
MAKYTERDIENVLADVASGIPTATAAARHGILCTTLYNCISGLKHHKSAHANVQQLSIVQEEYLARWILGQKSLNYAPMHAQVCTITTGILKQVGDHCPLGKKRTSHFIGRHPELKTKLGCQTDWERINAATSENIQ